MLGRESHGTKSALHLDHLGAEDVPRGNDPSILGSLQSIDHNGLEAGNARLECERGGKGASLGIKQVQVVNVARYEP